MPAGETLFQPRFEPLPVGIEQRYQGDRNIADQGRELGQLVETVEAVFEFASVPALLAAHLTFIAAANCAQRLGERLNLRFAFLTASGFCASILCAGTFLWIGVKGLSGGRARTDDSLLGAVAFTASIASSFRRSLASFCGPFWRRFSSRRIFFLKFLSFMTCALARAERKIHLKLMTKLL